LIQVVIYYLKEKNWEERFYHGVVGEVGDTVLREWGDKVFVQVKLRVDFSDGSKEVRCCTQSTHTAHSSFAHTQFTLSICEISAHTQDIQSGTHRAHQAYT